MKYNSQVDIFQIREIFARREIQIMIFMGAMFSNHSDMVYIM